jgi:hypothetical protein
MTCTDQFKDDAFLLGTYLDVRSIIRSRHIAYSISLLGLLNIISAIIVILVAG